MPELSDITAIFERFTNETGILITEKARMQIVDLINCVELDPHETWRPQQDLLEEYFHQWQTRLPGVLMQIAREHRLVTRMTTIDVVYWTGRHLRDREVWACFPGRGERPNTTMDWFPWPLERSS
jgi:hypothetical protein